MGSSNTAWSDRERLLAVGLMVATVALVSQTLWYHRLPARITLSPDIPTDPSPLEFAGAPIVDEADPDQARHIRTPGDDVAPPAGVTKTAAIKRQAAERRAAQRAQQEQERLQAEKMKQNDGQDRTLTPEQIDAALVALEAMEWGPEAERRLTEFMRTWGKQDPAAALDYALGLESNKARSSIMKAVFGAWMKEDPAMARAWFQQMLQVDPLGVDVVAGMVFKELAGLDPARGLKEISALPGNSLKRSALSALVSQRLAQKDLDGLFQLHGSLDSGIDQDLFTEAILRGAAIYYPDAVAEWALTLTEGHSRRVALDGFVNSWSGDQPISASDWVVTLADPEERSRSIATVAKNWAREDAVATGDWLISLKPPSPTLDPAIANFAKAVMKDNPAGAMAWAATVADEKQRNSLMTQVAKQWAKTDADAALAYLQNIGASATLLEFVFGKSEDSR